MEDIRIAKETILESVLNLIQHLESIKTSKIVTSGKIISLIQTLSAYIHNKVAHSDDMEVLPVGFINGVDIYTTPFIKWSDNFLFAYTDDIRKDLNIIDYDDVVTLPYGDKKIEINGN